jgi:hypothetical protein
MASATKFASVSEKALKVCPFRILVPGCGSGQYGGRASDLIERAANSS